jgi:hypothetical protein
MPRLNGTTCVITGAARGQHFGQRTRPAAPGKNVCRFKHPVWGTTPAK